MIKTRIKQLFIASLFSALSGNCLCAQTAFYVSPKGSDSNNGSKTRPFRSISRAQKAVRMVNKTMNDDVVVYLSGGHYELNKTLIFGVEDSGRNGRRVIYKAWPGKTVIVSGGRKVTGWKRHKGNIYKASFDYDKKLRALTVNGTPARMARSKGLLHTKGGWGEFKVTGKEPWALTPGDAADGIKFPEKYRGKRTEAGLFKNAEDVELIANQSTWTRQRACVREIVKEGDIFIFKMQQPGFAFTQRQKWGAGRGPRNQWQLVNALPLLDEPGEFYFDKIAKTLYYMKRDGESLNNVVAPVLEKLIIFKGRSTKLRVKNLRFEGIAFSHNNFLLMDGGKSACSTIQATAMTVKFRQDGNWHKNQYNMTRPMDGAIEAYNAEGIVFVHCRFENLTGVGVNLINDTVNCKITNSVFKYITGSGIGIGHPQHYKIGDGDIFKNGVEGVCRGTLVHNNYFRNIAYEHIQCPAIAAFYIADTTISHNDISGLPYSGMSIGWGWGNSGLPTSTTMKNIQILNNRVTDVLNVLTDGGIIYILGNAPGSLAKGNYLSGAHTHHANGFHPDDATSNWEFTENVIENVGRDWIHLWSRKSHNNKVYNNFANKPDCHLEGKDSYFADNIIEKDAPKWKSAKARDIIKKAGLEEPFKSEVLK